jgi:hypothetical protein
MSLREVAAAPRPSSRVSGSTSSSRLKPEHPNSRVRSGQLPLRANLQECNVLSWPTRWMTSWWDVETAPPRAKQHSGAERLSAFSS